ncbi:unnamed protein product [Chondrus crispus]|uniref:Uncharacterized protein n=1 Tax=Chondrus crispus TaxID=2769 RepID=R7Q5X0_CHOCR|nr:unnamed protein product [Chondrus crispus]XP_005712582.1 unnamed protein product [Chondrus crispus]CDF32781.1 unnamed protein product [Chondrus crispus]CDF41073.1 unnamed protein product [Chondrus crispus]|eukprot:XP_005711367.1 unnamed protein product [Chondrus crispus]
MYLSPHLIKAAQSGGEAGNFKNPRLVTVPSEFCSDSVSLRHCPSPQKQSL